MWVLAFIWFATDVCRQLILSASVVYFSVMLFFRFLFAFIFLLFCFYFVFFCFFLLVPGASAEGFCASIYDKP